MAVVSVDEVGHDRGAGEDQQVRTNERTFIVILSSATDDPVEARDAPGVPKVNSPHPADPLDRRQTIADGGDGRSLRRGRGVLWLVEPPHDLRPLPEHKQNQQPGLHRASGGRPRQREDDRQPHRP